MNNWIVTSPKTNRHFIKNQNFNKMKPKQFLLVIVAIAFAANVNATDLPKMSLAPMKDSKTLLSIEHSVPTVCEVSIRNQIGELVYYCRTKKKVANYQKVFNLSQLDDGNYRLIVNSGDCTIKNDLAKINGKIAVTATRNEMKPFFSIRDEKVILSYLNFHNEKMTVHVYDGNEHLFSQALGDDLAIHRVINMKALSPGHYELLLSDKHNQYWFSFSM